MVTFLKPGPKNLITDIEGLYVGNAADANLKSGTTVLLGDEAFVAAVDVMGGAPGTRDTDLLSPDKTVQRVDALVLSGGSAFGLDAASGVTDALRAKGVGFPVAGLNVPIVPAAILFDLANGGDKNWGTNPYAQLGRNAVAKASASFELGTVGAGTGALTAAHKGGLGSASLVLENGVTVAALVAVNPIGNVTTPDGNHFWAAPFELSDEFGGMGPDLNGGQCFTPISLKNGALMRDGNTTIAIVATDAKISKVQAKRMAVAAQDGIARAIVPAHTPFDGDLVFAAATGKRVLNDPDVDMLDIGAAAAHCLARAIARGVYEAKPTPDDLLPAWRNRHS